MDGSEIVNEASVEVAPMWKEKLRYCFAGMPDMQRTGWGWFGNINQVLIFSC